jgi:outer membrane protein OmpA-like peptidoglycan-associated protein
MPRAVLVSIAAGLALFVAHPVAAQQRPPADRRAFLACPIVRDTKTVPCFLAELDGELYFLGIQEDTGAAWYPPQLGHKVLVEGTVSPGPRVCGGIVLKPVVTSVIPELDPSCSTMLPAEEGIDAPEARRGPGPSSVRPAEGAAPAAPPSAPTPPFQVREFTVPFDFDNDFMPGRLTRVIADAVRYAKAIGSSRIEVTSFRGATLLSSGETLVEDPRVAERRAKKLQTILTGLGIPAASLTVTWKTEPETPTGVGDERSRRVTLTVHP